MRIDLAVIPVRDGEPVAGDGHAVRTGIVTVRVEVARGVGVGPCPRPNRR